MPDAQRRVLKRFAWFAQPSLLLAASAAFAMSTLFSAMKPVLLTRFLQETNWGESLAGVVVAMPFLGIAAASALFYFRPPALTVRSLGWRFGSVLVESLGLYALAYATAISMSVCALLLWPATTPGLHRGRSDALLPIDACAPATHVGPAG